MIDHPIIFGRYQLLAALSRGGMGEVWKARSRGVEGFEKVLIIKRILPALSRDPRFVQMFIDEAKIAVALTHANIVQVFDLGVVDGTYFIAMEYVPGWDLGEVLRRLADRKRRMPPELSVHLAAELAKGLDYAHRRRDRELRPLGIVHCDVSPENILLSREGDVKLTDFGIARTRASIFPPHERPTGKFAYLAPEQARAGEVDGRADVFSVGAVLFELLTGEKALLGVTRDEAFQRALRAEHRAIEEVEPDLPPDLIAIVSRTMKASPSDRYASAGELYEELIHYLHASGRRVGALDMARFLESIASPDSAQPEPPGLGPLSGVEEIFSERAPVLTSSVSLGITPVQVQVRGEVGSSVPLPPRSEWREASLLAAEGVDAGEFARVVAQQGGEVLSTSLDPPSGAQVGLFGLLRMDGRDAQAAARAALRLLARREDPQPCRALVHSGRLLVDAEQRADHDASLGLMRTDALRALSLAPPGAASASPLAVRALRACWQLRPAEAGAPRIIERALRVDEGAAKFVGRRDELRAVGEAFAAANRGQLRVVGVRGEAGSGKSRLIAETHRRLRHAGHDVGMLVAHCEGHDGTTAFAALESLLRAVVEADENEAGPALRSKLDKLRRFALSTAEREAVEGLLGLGGVPQAEALSAALVRIARALAEERFTVFVWDDADRMDEESRALLGRALRRHPIERLAVLLTHRPSEHRPWTQWPNFLDVRLKPLSIAEVTRLIRHRLQVADLPAELVTEVAARTDGNPLYIEELIAAMCESHALEVRDGKLDMRRSARVVELPRTLRALVAASAGPLSAAQRALLQLAATFGANLTPALLATASGQDEASVRQGLSLLLERGVLRAAGADEYVFAHDLVREVVLGAIPIEQRPALHARAAAALEAAGGAAGTERLAYHHRQAGHRVRAVELLREEARLLEAEQADDAAIDTYGQVLELLAQGSAPDREQMLEIYARMAELAFRARSTEAVADRLGHAVELADSMGRDDYLARFAMLRGRLLNKASRFQEGRVWLERAQGLARRLGAVDLERDVALSVAEAYVRNGEFSAAIERVREALELVRDAEEPMLQVRALSVGAPAYAAVGRMDLALAALREIDALSDSQDDRYLRVEVMHVRALVHSLGDDVERAMAAARKALELAREYEMPYEVATLAYLLATLCVRAHDDKRAFLSLQLSYDLATEYGYARLQWLNVCLLGFLEAMRSGAEQARGRMMQAVRYAEGRGYVWDAIIEKYVLAMVEQRLGRAADAARLLREVRELCEVHGHKRMVESVHRALQALGSGAAMEGP